ncbi:MAG: transposase [Nitrospira sp.]|nr:transposase [Nitrospira sp.]
MKRKRFSEAQISGVLKDAEAGVKKQDLCRKPGITEQTFYRWRSKYGGLQVSDVTRLKQLEAENRQLKQLLADAHLDQAALKELLSKNWYGPRHGAKRWPTWSHAGW